MIVSHWIRDAAREISPVSLLSVDGIMDVIRKHFPFEEGVLYMPVPRCETCKHCKLDKINDPELGICLVLNKVVRIDFGCVKWETK